MNYFFGNARNEKGLCATPDCTREPVQTMVFKYCDQCFDRIMGDLAAGRAPNLEQIPKTGVATVAEPLAEASTDTP